MEEENKILVVLLVVAIVISLVNLFVPRKVTLTTGKVTSSGELKLTVSSTTAINFTTNNIDFGTGYVTPGSSYCSIDTAGGIPSGCTGFTAPSSGFVIENIGNTDVKLQLATGKNATQLLGGTSPEYKYKVSEVETGSCVNINPTAYTPVNNTAPGTTICNPLYAKDSTDTVRIDVMLKIPSDSNTGLLTDTFTATATAT